MISKRNSTSNIIGPIFTGGPAGRGKGSGGRGFSIADFSSFRNDAGILRTHDFHVEIPWPEALVRDPGMVDTWKTLEMTCDSINFPATVLHTYQVHRYSYGPTEKKPTFPKFADLQCTFLTDQSAAVWQFFHRWQQIAVNYDFSPYLVQGGLLQPYEISYTHEYAVDMKLYIYNPYGTPVRKIGFRQAYPITIGDVNHAWSPRGQPVRVPVTFAFFDINEESPS